MASRPAAWLVPVVVVALAAAGRAEERSLEADALRWALTYAPSPRGLLVPPEDPEERAATEILGSVDGATEPGRRALLGLAGGDGRTAALARERLTSVQRLEDMVERRGLDHAVGYLLSAGQEKRVRAILPESAPRRSQTAWWSEHARAHRWLPALDRFRAWEPWGADQAPLRFRDRDGVRLAGSEGLVRLDGAVTVELWVRCPSADRSQYLLTDEAWPEMSPRWPAAQKRGFALRKNPRGDGTASLELVCAVDPDHWFSVESAPLRVTDDWEHVALSSDGRTVRLFRDGELVAARSLRGVKLHPGLGDLTVGVREGSWPDRRANFDLRALRIAEAAAYTADFVPGQRLTIDVSTLLALDFTPGTSALRDVSGNEHAGILHGPAWVAALSASDVRGALEAFGAMPGTLELFEADRGGWSAEWYSADRNVASEGVNAELWSTRDPDDAGHWITVPVTAPAAGRYRLHVLGPGLEHLGADGLTSPFSWRIDNGRWNLVTEPLPAIRGVGGRSMANLSPLGVVDLKQGHHLFRLRVVARRAHDDRYSFWFDAIALEQVSRSVPGTVPHR